MPTDGRSLRLIPGGVLYRCQPGAEYGIDPDWSDDDEPPRSSPMPEPTVHTVTIRLCTGCLDGAGGECHTPGCALYLNRAPDLALRNVASPAESLAVHTGPESCEAGCPIYPWRCGGTKRLHCIACSPATIDVACAVCACTGEIDCPGCDDCAGGVSIDLTQDPDEATPAGGTT